MHRINRTLLPAIAILLLLASCHSVPKHARFIPKDALFVLGIHTDKMRRELTWSAITGSSLMDEMRRTGRNDKVPDMLKDAENAGIDFTGTLYFYTKPDTRFSNSTRVAAVLPVSDAKKVTAYILKHAPGIAIRSVHGRNEAMVDGKVYIGWNDEVLIAMNTIVKKTEHNESAKLDTLGGAAIQGDAYSWTEETADSAATAAEMEAAFNPAKDAAIADNGRFKELEAGAHDITMWLSYDALMEAYGRKGMGMMGITMGNTLWKSSALATGVDFEKGRIDAEMRYYASDSMRDVAKEFGKENIDQDMLRRLPAAGLDFAAGYHISMKGLRMMLDKMGLTGMANLALMQKGMSVDDILGAFAGDLAASVNNFRVESKMQEIDSATQKDFGLTPYSVPSPKMDFVFAMKTGDKAKMNKLVGLLISSELLQQTAPNTYTFPYSANGTTFVVGDKYIAVSSSAAGAQAFLKDASGKMPVAVDKEIAGHPAGMWTDVQGLLAGAEPLAKSSPSDSAAFNAVRNLFTTFTGHGGEFKGNATEYHLSIGFTNKEENSLVQLLHLAQQLVAANNSKQVVMR